MANRRLDDSLALEHVLFTDGHMGVANIRKRPRQEKGRVSNNSSDNLATESDRISLRTSAGGSGGMAVSAVTNSKAAVGVYDSPGRGKAVQYAIHHTGVGRETRNLLKQFSDKGKCSAFHPAVHICACTQYPLLSTLLSHYILYVTFCRRYLRMQSVPEC